MAQTGAMMVSETTMPCRPPMASDRAPMMTEPAKPPKTSEYTPNMAKQMVRISGGAVAAKVMKMQMARGDTAGIGQELQDDEHPQLRDVERGDDRGTRRPMMQNPEITSGRWGARRK